MSTSKRLHQWDYLVRAGLCSWGLGFPEAQILAERRGRSHKSCCCPVRWGESVHSLVAYISAEHTELSQSSKSSSLFFFFVEPGLCRAPLVPPSP